MNNAFTPRPEDDAPDQPDVDPRDARPGSLRDHRAGGRGSRGFRAETGLATVFCRHTSASLLIQENADPDVKADLSAFFARLAPEGLAYLRHTTEGPDDMPAHIRAALTQTTLSIPIVGGRLALGTWQGLYLFEHRRAPHRRTLVLHLMGA